MSESSSIGIESFCTDSNDSSSSKSRAKEKVYKLCEVNLIWYVVVVSIKGQVNVKRSLRMLQTHILPVIQSLV